MANTSHRAREPWYAKLLKNKAVLAGSIAGLIVLGGSTYAAVAASVNNDQIICPPGANQIVHPGGTWECDGEVTPTSPSASPIASPEPSSSPSPSPSTTTTTTSPSPSPSTTTTSPTPSPSTTTTGPVLKNCWLNPGACGYPTPATTGYPRDLTLTNYSGSTNFNQNVTTTIDGKKLGCVVVTKGTLIIRNSLITCSGGKGIDVYGTANLVVESTEISCVTGLGTGIDRSSNAAVSASKLYIHSCENGFWMESNTSIVDSFISVVTIGHAHSDGIQAISATNLRVEHNTIMPDDFDNGVDGATSSIIMAGQTMNGLVIRNNLLSSGQYTLYCPSGGSNNVITGNRFAGPVRAQFSSTVGTVYGPNSDFTDNCNHADITWSGNVRDDTGATLKA